MSTATINEPLVITDAGPIENLTIPIPPGGGVVVLSGRNGSGKTTAINATESLIGGKPSVSPRDGSQKAVITGFGATLRVGRRASRTGELEVESLDGKLTPAVFVEPGLKSPDAADAMRIKALLQLVNARPDLNDFYKLLQDKATFERYVPEDFSDETDVVALAAKIKRSLEQTARREEAIAANEAGKAVAYKKAVEDIDTTQVPDTDRIQDELEAAVAHQSRLTEQAVQSERLSKQAALAREQLDNHQPAKRDRLRRQIEEAVSKRDKLRQQCNDHYDDVVEAEKELQAAQVRLRNAKNDHSTISLHLDNAQNNVIALTESDAKQQEMEQSHEAAVNGWKQSIDAAEQCECPSVVDLENASAAIKSIRSAIEDAAVVRHALQQVEKAAEHKAKSDESYKTAEKLRESAKATDDILSDLVSQCGTALSVRSGRLMVKTRRGLTLFSELSHGERWKIAIDVALQAFPEHSDHLPLLTVEQEAWEGLDPTNRGIIAAHARERGVLILTAECSDSITVTAAEFN